MHEAGPRSSGVADREAAARAAPALALLTLALTAISACAAPAPAPPPSRASAPLRLPSTGAGASLQLDVASLRRQGLPETVLASLARSRFRYFRMLAEPFELRVCSAFRDRLPSLPIGVVQGDAHLEQLVVTSATYGLEDFDRAGIGPAVVDLVRYAASLHVACSDVPWRCDPDAAVERFLSTYRAGLLGTSPPPATPRIVQRLRARAVPSRTSWLARVDALMRPLPASRDAAARQGWWMFARTLMEQHRHLPPGALDIVRLGALQMGFGSALERKLLFRLAGPTARPDDDLVVEGRSGMAPTRTSCIARDSYGEARAWMLTALLGRRMPELQGLTFVPGIGQLWLQSWDPGYVELAVTDLSSQAELDELATDAAHQLTGAVAVQLPLLLARYQRIAQRQAFDELRPRIEALARSLAAESNQGWTWLRRTLGK